MNGIILNQSPQKMSTQDIYDLIGYTPASLDSVTDLQQTVSLKAPQDHADTGSKYGLGTPTRYGHTKVINELESSGTVGVALAANQGRVLNNKITSLQDIIEVLNTYEQGTECYLDYGSTVSNLTCVATSETTYHLTGKLEQLFVDLRKVGDTVDDNPIFSVIDETDLDIDVYYDIEEDGPIFEDGACLYAACSLFHTSIDEFFVGSQAGFNLLGTLSVQDIVNELQSNSDSKIFNIQLCFTMGSSSNPYDPTIWPTTRQTSRDTQKDNIGYFNPDGPSTQTLQEKITDLENRISALESVIS